MKINNNKCPGCDSFDIQVFYEIHHVPTHRLPLIPTREIAINDQKGSISLGFCKTCGFISNIEYEPDKQESFPAYEESHEFFRTCNVFEKHMAHYLIERYDLHNKKIIEIGCGRGEFLSILCNTGRNYGIGFDPDYMNGQNSEKKDTTITFINDFYSEKYAHYQSDLICCRMTLEHIYSTSKFLHTIRNTLGNRKDTIIFFQVHDIMHTLHKQAFWNIYYEHCSYFSPGSLARLFRKCGFDVCNIWKDYNNQYIMLEAKPGKCQNTTVLDIEEYPEDALNSVVHFLNTYKKKINYWKNKLQQMKQDNRKVVIWGSDSESVAFLTSLAIQDEIEFVVDTNPYKQGMYMAGTGQKIVNPDFLQKYKPDAIIIVNPMYISEIRQELYKIGLFTDLVTV
ncbi:MAG: methyltransferase domain-containing protein [Planctomycetes bacterium]|nr:methyltransferase domain-containing protein [Planctomycetota bacterium]